VYFDSIPQVQVCVIARLNTRDVRNVRKRVLRVVATNEGCEEEEVEFGFGGFAASSACRFL